jgi:predicted metalloprotease with PDZ domain
MRQIPKICLPVLLLALLVAAVPAFAGGEKCATEAKAPRTPDHAQQGSSQHERVAARKKAGWTGMETEKDEQGAYRVSWVQAGSPAAEAGVRVGDRLVAYQGIEIAEENKGELKAAKKDRHVGARVTYTVARGAERMDLRMELVEVPDSVIARWLSDEPAGEAVASVDN